MKRILVSILLAVSFAASAQVSIWTQKPIAGGAFNSALAAPNGTTCSAPSYSFAAQLDRGFSNDTTNLAIGICNAGTLVGDINGVGMFSLGGFFASSTGSINFSNGALGTAADVSLFRGGADVLQQRRGTNAQQLQLYNTFTDASNGEWASFSWITNVLNIGTEKNGTGSTRGINIRIGGATAWAIDASGNATAQGNQSITTGGTQSGVNAGRFNATVGTAPAIGVCGTSPSLTGKDSAMKVTVGTGGVATTCSVTFGATWTNPPTCIAQNDTDRVSYSMVTTATALTITATAAITASSKFHVVCFGQ